jgi:hypothetical protein
MSKGTVELQYLQHLGGTIGYKDICSDAALAPSISNSESRRLSTMLTLLAG